MCAESLGRRLFDSVVSARFIKASFAFFTLAATVSLPGDALTSVRAAAHAVLSSGEARASRAFEAAKKQGAPSLYAFLKPMPKGADLHMHLSGAIYAETFIFEAARQGVCIASVDSGVPAAPSAQGALRFVTPVGNNNECPRGDVSATEALKNQKLYDALIDSFSMRAYVPTPGINGHDQFFATFDRYGGLKAFVGEWLHEVASRAGAQNEQYLEIMQTPSFSHAIIAANKIGWPAGSERQVNASTLAHLRDSLLASGLRDDVAIDAKELADAKEAMQKQFAADGQSQAQPVKIHWIYQVLRGFPPQQVFAQTLLGFEVASADPDVVGINFVMPEDGRLSMQDYHIQMQMVDYLHGVYPKVHISLHAGELAPGMVRPDGLSFHIREAVELGHAERIGHGVDVLYEDAPASLLKEMAQKHVMVEVNLTSNDVILGIKGSDHPLSAYRLAHVPMALSTDDEGVSRIDLTHEYVRGAMDQGLSYAELKNMARTSLEHSFMPGESLWAAPDDFAHRKAVCAGTITAEAKPSASCSAFLQRNERASEQWELERRFAAFEAGVQ